MGQSKQGESEMSEIGFWSWFLRKSREKVTVVVVTLLSRQTWRHIFYEFCDFPGAWIIFVLLGLFLGIMFFYPWNLIFLGVIGLFAQATI